MATVLQKLAERMALLRDALTELSAPRKTLPGKCFYGAEGSWLFEAICELPKHHVTRMGSAQIMGHATPETRELLVGTAFRFPVLFSDRTLEPRRISPVRTVSGAGTGRTSRAEDHGACGGGHAG